MATRSLQFFLAVLGMTAAAPAAAQSLSDDSLAWYPFQVQDRPARGEPARMTIGAKMLFMSVRTDGSEIVTSRRGPRIRDRYDLTDEEIRGPDRWRSPTRGTLAASMRVRF